MEGKITAIKAQKRNTNRINIYLDDQYAFGVSKIVAAWLQIGQYVDEHKINTLLEQDAIEVDCEFCNKRYVFDKVDAEQAFASEVTTPAPKSLH